MKPRAFLDLLAPLSALALMLLAFSLLSTPGGQPVRTFFLTGENAQFIAAQSIVTALGTLGMALVLLNGGIDLSAGAAAALAGVVAAVLLQHGLPMVAAILAAALAGGALGMLNGALIATLRIAPFIVTLGTLGLARGAARWIAGGMSVAVPEAGWLGALLAPLPEPAWLLVAPGAWLALLLAGVATLFLRTTVFGRHLVAVGSNEAAARLCGVRVRLTKTGVYTVAGLFFGVAGVAQMGAAGQADSAGVPGLELDFIAAAVIGGVRLGGGTGTLPGALLGALVMTVLRNGCQQAGWPVPAQEMVVGGAIIAAAGLDRLRCRSTAGA